MMNPPPGSKAAEAKEFGIDLTLLVENLRLTPSERIRKLQSIMRTFDKMEKMRASNRGRTRAGL